MSYRQYKEHQPLKSNSPVISGNFVYAQRASRALLGTTHSQLSKNEHQSPPRKQ